MIAEIIAVGTEMLLGQIVNTNARYLSQECAGIGIDVYFQTVVGDNAGRLKEAIRIAGNRADLIICTGGLGPTQDDLTRDVVAEYIGKELQIHQHSMDRMIEMFHARNIEMTPNNARQALMIEGAVALNNDTGLAVGSAITVERNHYILLPGPPREMIPMFNTYGKPWIHSLLQNETPLYSKLLKFAGIGESNVEHKLLDLIDNQSDPTIAPYAKEGEVTIRLSTKALSKETGMEKLHKVEEEIRARLGQYLFAEEDVTMEQEIIRLLSLRRQTLSVAESCSGGLLGDLLTTIPGSSTVFTGGVICYSNAVKNSILQIPMEILSGDGSPGAISPETAHLMAQNLLPLTHTDYSLAITGEAGPNPSENKPVGLVYIGLAEKGKAVQVEKLQLSGNREMIKLKACKQALYFLWRRLMSVE